MIYEIIPWSCSALFGGWMKALFFRKPKHRGINARVTYCGIWYQSVEQTERVCGEDICGAGCPAPLIPQLHYSNHFPAHRIQDERRQESCKTPQKYCYFIKNKTSLSQINSWTKLDYSFAIWRKNNTFLSTSIYCPNPGNISNVSSPTVSIFKKMKSCSTYTDP